MPQILPEWIAALTLQQQSVLLLALRGPDGAPKHHPSKGVIRAYRGTVVLAARVGRTLTYGEHADTFMSLQRFADNTAWAEDLDAYFDAVDSIPHHYQLHLLHGAEILGYKHPDPQFRARWSDFYLRAVDDMHLEPETEATMDTRLNDWDQNGWDTPTAPDPRQQITAVRTELEHLHSINARSEEAKWGAARATEIIERAIQNAATPWQHQPFGPACPNCHSHPKPPPPRTGTGAEDETSVCDHPRADPQPTPQKAP